MNKIEPQFDELMRLSRRARLLPHWSAAIKTRGAGGYVSKLRGRGMEYDESRPYQPGDDVRHLDWRVTARSGKAHTKVFREERERPVFVCVDYRRAMFFATQGIFKAVQAARCASLLAWKSQLNGDRIGGVIFSSIAHHEIAPQRARTAATQLLRRMTENVSECRSASGADDEHELAEALVRLNRLARPGSLIFLLSDFRGFDEAVGKNLIRLALHNDVVLLQINDPIESHFPTTRAMVSLADERHQITLPSIGKRQRQQYENRYQNSLSALKSFCTTHRLRHGMASTVQDCLAATVRLLS